MRVFHVRCLMLACVLAIADAVHPATFAQGTGGKLRHSEIKGKLVTEGTRAPVSGLQIWLGKPKRSEGGSYSLELVKLGAETDASGSFSIKEVPPGTYGMLAGFSILKTADAKGHVDIEVGDRGGIVDLGTITVRK